MRDIVDPQTDAIELDPLHVVVSETTRIIYGKSRLAWKNWFESLLSKTTMSDFTTTDSTKWFHFTDRERREVIVVDISLGILLIHIIDELDI
jgi:hypothetical protein